MPGLFGPATPSGRPPCSTGQLQNLLDNPLLELSCPATWFRQSSSSLESLLQRHGKDLRSAKTLNEITSTLLNHRGHPGRRITYEGKTKFVPVSSWTSCTRNGKRVLYCRLLNVYLPDLKGPGTYLMSCIYGWNPLNLFFYLSS